MAKPTVLPTPGASVGLVGLTSEGEAIATRHRAEPSGSDFSQLTQDTTLGIWKAGDLTPEASTLRETRGFLRGRARQISAVRQTGHRLVWTETASTDLDYNEWSIRTVDLDTHRVREVAHSKELRGDARLLDVAGGTYPVVIKDWVYWATAVPLVDTPSPTRRADWEFDVQRAALSKASSVETVARNAVMPAALDGALVYASYSGSKANVYEIHRQEVSRKRSDRILVRGYRSGTSWITNLAASGKLLVWTAQSPDLAKEGWVPGESEPGVLFVLDTETQNLTKVVTADEAGGNASIAFTRQGVAWGNGSGNGDPGEYILKLDTGTLEKLGTHQGFSMVIANPKSDVVLWSPKSDRGGKVTWKRGELA